MTKAIIDGATGAYKTSVSDDFDAAGLADGDALAPNAPEHAGDVWDGDAWTRPAAVAEAIAAQETRNRMVQTDPDMARVAEDLAEWSFALLDALQAAGAIDAATRAQLALPAGAIAKINARRAIRGDAQL